MFNQRSTHTNVSDIAERLAILEERFQDLIKRCHLQTLEIGDVKSAHSILDSLVLKPSINCDVVYAMEVFNHNYIVDYSPFYLLPSGGRPRKGTKKKQRGGAIF